MSGLLRDAMIQAISRKKTNESKVDAILDLLGMDENDAIVNMADVSTVMAFAQAAGERLAYFSEDPEGWDDDDYEAYNKAFDRLHTLMPSHLFEEEEDE